MTPLRILLVLLLTLLAWPATAPHSHETIPTPHDGQAIAAGEYHIELVAKGDVVEVHVTDHDDKAVKVAGFKGLAILAVDGKSLRIVLEPAGGAMLTGKAAGTLPKAPKGVVQLTPPGGKTIQGRFR